MLKDIRVVIVGGLHHNTLGVVRSLGKKGLKKNNIIVILIGEKISRSNFIMASRYLSKSNVHIIETNDDILKQLYKIAIDEKQVIICCSDGAAEVVMSNYEDLKKWFFLPRMNADVRDFMSKEVQDCFAKKCGLNIPDGAIICKNDIFEWDDFPCITKPIKSVHGAGKSDIRISYNKKELEIALNDTVSDTVQIQKFIEKDMEYQLIGCSIDDGSTIIIPGYTKIIRQPSNTNTGYLKYSSIQDFKYDKEAVHRYIKGIGYNGLFSIEFIRGKDGIDYFLEMNMRNDGNAYCVYSAGVNLPYIWSYFQVYNEVPKCEYTFTKPVYFIPDLLDLKRGISEVGFFGWCKEFVQAKSHAVFDLTDIGPFVLQSVSFAKWFFCHQ